MFAIRWWQHYFSTITSSWTFFLQTSFRVLLWVYQDFEKKTKDIPQYSSPLVNSHIVATWTIMLLACALIRYFPVSLNPRWIHHHLLYAHSLCVSSLLTIPGSFLFVILCCSTPWTAAVFPATDCLRILIGAYSQPQVPNFWQIRVSDHTPAY